MSAQDDQKSGRSAGDRLWKFLNSSFGLFILSSVVLSFVTWMYTEVSQSIEQRIVNAEKATKLDTEISYRISLLDGYFKSDCAKDSELSTDTFVDIRDIYKANPAFQAIFREYREKDLHTLIWEKAALSEPGEKKDFVESFDRLLPINAYLNRLLRQISASGTFYDEVPDFRKEVDGLIAKFSTAIEPIKTKVPGLVTRLAKQTGVDSEQVNADPEQAAAKSKQADADPEQANAKTEQTEADSGGASRALDDGDAGPDGTKPLVHVGTIGHVAHGKTTLIAAITARQATKGLADYVALDRIDNTPEVRQRGITMAISHVEYETDTRRYVHVDSPNHADYVKNIITGAAQMHIAILVVNVAEGPVPQTREQVLLARRAGVPHIVVFLNTANLVNEEPQVRHVGRQIRELLSRYGYPGDEVPVVSGSAQMASKDPKNAEANASIEELLSVLDAAILPERAVDRPFLMPIEDVFSISGRGTVVTGRVERGVVSVGDEVEILGLKGTKKTVVTGIEMFRKILDQAVVGDNIGALLRDVGREDVERGQVLAKPGSITPHTNFKAEAYILAKEEGGRHTPFFTDYRPQFYFRTTDVTGVVSLPEGTEMAMPGDKVSMDVELIAPIAMDEGLRFAIREGGRTVGAGVVYEILE